MADDYDDLRREILSQVEADVAEFIASLDQDAPSGVPPPPKIEVTEVSAQPVEIDLLPFGGQETGVTPGPPAPPPEPGCSCPRDITEVGGWHVNALVAGGDCYTGAKLMSRTWLRINHEEEFSEPRQFKLWLDEDCVIQYEDNRTTSPYIVEEDTAGVVSIRLVITTLEFTNTPSPKMTIGLYYESYLEAFPEGPPLCRSTVEDTDVGVELCDFTPILTPTAFNGTQLCECDGDPTEDCSTIDCWSASGTMYFFGPV